VKALKEEHLASPGLFDKCVFGTLGECSGCMEMGCSSTPKELDPTLEAVLPLLLLLRYVWFTGVIGVIGVNGVDMTGELCIGGEDECMVLNGAIGVKGVIGVEGVFKEG